MAGAIHGVAVDAGSGLAAAIAQARGAQAEDGDLLTFKRSVVETLGPDASTVLVDAACGRDLLPSFPMGCAPMLAFEADVYHISDADRITVLPDNLNVEDYPGLGVKDLKFFMYYAPDDDAELNARKQTLVADIGARCRAAGIRYLMEPLVYHPTLQPGTAAYAAAKPDLVRRATEVFADPRFAVDVLKVEIPVDLGFVEGFGQPEMSVSDAHSAFRAAAAPAKGIDLVYLSAGVAFEAFEASLCMAREAGVAFDGFMCGRAIWSDAVAIFGARGERGLRDWLGEEGRARLARLVAAVR
ncbi:MAG: tagatose 1,6-diphosphate aldolase [Pseudomonadota bacterium]